jgi:uncharacterized protein YndB with AHSA1/START domain
MDVRAGGTWRYTMHGPDGRDWPNIVRYTDVSPPARLVYRHGDEDADGAYRHAFDVTIDFDDDGPRHTRVTMQMVFPDRAARDLVIEQFGALQGARENLDRLETFLADEFVITRRFAAPRALLWKMLSDAPHLERWWGPAGVPLAVESLDFRVGGHFHYRMGDGDGATYGVKRYVEIEEPRRLVFTNGFCDAAMSPRPAPFADEWPLRIRNEFTLDEVDGVTELHVLASPVDPTPAALATFRRHFESMRAGYGGSFDKLQHHLDDLFRETER